jgi:hypothetical protein
LFVDFLFSPFGSGMHSRAMTCKEGSSRPTRVCKPNAKKKMVIRTPRVNSFFSHNNNNNNDNGGGL